MFSIFSLTVNNRSLSLLLSGLSLLSLKFCTYVCPINLGSSCSPWYSVRASVQYIWNPSAFPEILHVFCPVCMWSDRFLWTFKARLFIICGTRLFSLNNFYTRLSNICGIRLLPLDILTHVCPKYAGSACFLWTF